MSLGNEVQKYWWEAPKEKLHEEIFRIILFLDTNQSYREEDLIKNLERYANFESMGLSASDYARSNATSSKKSRVTFNVIQSCVDTSVAKISKNKVKALFVSSGGDAHLWDKAKKLNKFSEGQLFNTGFFELAPKILRDAGVWGTGIVHPYRIDGKIFCERVMPNELVVDDAESIYGEPRQIHRKKYVPREVAKMMFPQKVTLLANTKEHKPQSGYTTLSDLILIVESWHLPTNAQKDNGLHTITVENGTLVREAYKKDYFPFAFLRWNPKMVGFWGQGLAEILKGLQAEINHLLRTIQLSMRLCSVPRFWREVGSRVVKSHINNEVGAIVDYTGTKPILDNSNAVPPELREHLQYLIQLAYELSGISQLSASSKKPAGLDSGRALREFSDIETERFALVGQAWEQLHLDVIKQFIDLAKEINEELKAKGEDGFAVKIKGKKFLESIKWDDIDLEEDEYLMQVFPTSMLSDSPSGRIQDIQEMMQAGMMDPQFGMKLLNIPDTEMYINFMTASLDDILATIEQLSQGTYQAPESFQDLQLGLRLIQFAYLMYKNEGLPESRLELFRRWLEEADATMKQAQQPSMGALAQAPQPGNAVPQGRAAKPPVNNMIPFQQGAPSPEASSGATIG